jgi:hypothetical protein
MKLGNKFCAFYGTQNFIIAFTTVRQFPITWQTKAIHNLSSYSSKTDILNLPLIFPEKCCMHLSSLPYVPRTQPISFFLIWSPENARDANHCNEVVRKIVTKFGLHTNNELVTICLTISSLKETLNPSLNSNVTDECFWALALSFRNLGFVSIIFDLSVNCLHT